MLSFFHFYLFPFAQVVNALHKVLVNHEEIDNKVDKIWKIAKNNTVEQSAIKLVNCLAS